MRVQLDWDKSFKTIGVSLDGLGKRVRRVAENGIGGIAKNAVRTLEKLTPAESINSTGKLKKSWVSNRKKLTGTVDPSIMAAVTTGPSVDYGISYRIENTDPRAYAPILFKRGKTNLLDILEYGTGTHVGRPRYKIEAKNAKSLKFVVGGKTVFAKSVMHPGVRPYAMRRVAMAEASRAATGLLKTIQLLMSRHKPTGML